jgi:salicylate hydroxylase
MADGAAQQARDEALKRAAAGGKSPDRWGDKETQRRLYGLDVVKQADQEYARL